MVMWALALAALACNLGSDSGDSPPTAMPTPFPTVMPVATQPVIIVTATPYPTNQPLPTSIPATQFNCTPQSGWPVYIVQTGDTLGEIATRTRTTVETLTQANCLTNAELIYAGQSLFVPFVPATLTPVPTAVPSATPNTNVPVFTQALTVDQHWRDAGGFAVTYLDTVRVNAGEVLQALQVEFYVNDPGSSNGIYIGIDLDPWDGAFVDYTFPAPGTYTFQAVAHNEQTTQSSNVFTVRYDPNYAPPEGQNSALSISPIRGFDGSSYTLETGATVTIAWPNAPLTAARVDFTLAPTGTGSTPQIIGVDLAPSDGAMITWGVPAGVLGHLQAVATMPDNSTVTSQLALIVAG
jgi:LysM repeat protein